MSKEVEIKLAVAPDDMAVLRRALIAMADGARGGRSILISTYFDTSDHRLKRHERILRVRKHGRRFIQTVKTHDPAGADPLQRGEWEDQISGAFPDLAAPESGGQVHALKREDLHPLFTTSVERTVIELAPRTGSSIEAALDKGEISTADGERHEPISELELELKAGDPAVLYDLALRLCETVPLRLEIRSKAERGYALLESRTAKPPIFHVAATPLDGKITTEVALQGIGRRCLTAILRNEAAALTGRLEGIHQMRVAVRRLRAILSALKPLLPLEHFRWADHELKWLADALGPARNWDVIARHLLEPVAEALPDEPGLRKLHSAADERRQAAHQRAREAILSPRYTSTLLRLLRWFAVRGWCDQPVNRQSAQLVAPIGEVKSQLIARRYRQARKRARHFTALQPRQRHKLRIALKKLRYTIEFLQPLYSKTKIRHFMKPLKSLQDDLGHANDVRVAQQMLADIAEGKQAAALDRTAGIVLGWHDRGLAEREAVMRRHVRNMRRAKAFW